MVADANILSRARDAAATVCDPEIPGLSIADLGVLRDAVLVEGCCGHLVQGEPPPLLNCSA